MAKKLAILLLMLAPLGWGAGACKRWSILRVLGQQVLYCSEYQSEGASTPGTCVVGDTFFKTSGGSEGLYTCNATNVWTAAGGGGITVCSGTIAYTDAIFVAAAIQVSKSVCDLPAGSQIEGKPILYHGTAFAGTGVTTMTFSMGRTGVGNDQDYIPIPAYSLLTASATTMFAEGGTSMDLSAHSVYVFFNANTNFGNGAATVLTAGSMKYEIRYRTTAAY